MNKYLHLLLLIFFMCPFISIAQEKPQSNNATITKTINRTVVLKTAYIKNKQLKYIEVNGIKYRWFNSKTTAIEYAKNIKLKTDLLVLFVDCNEHMIFDDEIVTISEEYEENTIE